MSNHSSSLVTFLNYNVSGFVLLRFSTEQTLPDTPPQLRHQFLLQLDFKLLGTKTLPLPNSKNKPSVLIMYVFSLSLSLFPFLCPVLHTVSIPCSSLFLRTVKTNPRRQTGLTWLKSRLLLFSCWCGLWPRHAGVQKR